MGRRLGRDAGNGRAMDGGRDKATSHSVASLAVCMIKSDRGPPRRRSEWFRAQSVPLKVATRRPPLAWPVRFSLTSQRHHRKRERHDRPQHTHRNTLIEHPRPHSRLAGVFWRSGCPRATRSELDHCGGHRGGESRLRDIPLVDGGEKITVGGRQRPVTVKKLVGRPSARAACDWLVLAIHALWRRHSGSRDLEYRIMRVRS